MLALLRREQPRERVACFFALTTRVLIHWVNDQALDGDRGAQAALLQRIGQPSPGRLDEIARLDRINARVDVKRERIRDPNARIEDHDHVGACRLPGHVDSNVKLALHRDRVAA